MEQLSNGNYESLRAIQRIEIFKTALQKYDGNDLNTMCVPFLVSLLSSPFRASPCIINLYHVECG